MVWTRWFSNPLSSRESPFGNKSPSIRQGSIHVPGLDCETSPIPMTLRVRVGKLLGSATGDIQGSNGPVFEAIPVDQ